MEQSYHSFLMALKGKTVTIYKAGPESKKGKVLDVKPDYIALLVENNNNANKKQNDQDTVVYYQVDHIKSVIEDTKTNSMQNMEELPDVEYHHSDCFIGLLEQFIDQTIQINQGGPQSKHGVLVAVFDDFLVLFTEDDGLVYFNTYHVKSVSMFKQNDETNNQPTMLIPEWICVDEFQDVFKYLSHQWVSINRGGPDAMEGVLVENVGGHYTLVNNQEVMRIHPFHIQSISVGPKGHLKQQNNNENKNQEKNEESSNESNESSSSCNESSSSKDESSSSKDESSSSKDESSSSSNESSSSSNESSSSSGKRSTGKKRSTRRRSSRHRSHKEKIIKSIDYKWKY